MVIALFQDKCGKNQMVGLLPLSFHIDVRKMAPDEIALCLESNYSIQTLRQSDQLKLHIGLPVSSIIVERVRPRREDIALRVSHSRQRGALRFMLRLTAHEHGTIVRGSPGDSVLLTIICIVAAGACILWISPSMLTRLSFIALGILATSQWWRALRKLQSQCILMLAEFNQRS